VTDAPKMTPIDIVRADEAWSTIELANGMMIRIKVVVAGVALVEGSKDAFGNENYQIAHQIVVSPAIPVKGLANN